MSNQVILYAMGVVVLLFIAVVIAYIALRKRMNQEDIKQARELRAGAQTNTLSL